MKLWKIKLIQYGSCILFGALLVWLYLSGREFPGADRCSTYFMLCDAFTVPGLLMTMIGALLWASSLGAMDGLGYVMNHLFKALIPGAAAKADSTYYDYVTDRKAKRLQFTKYAFLFVTGLAFLAVAVVFLVLYYKTK